MTDSRINDKEPQAGGCCQPRVQSIAPATESSGNADAAIPAARWIVGKMTTVVGDIPIVDTQLHFSDKLGSWKARWGIGRMTYLIEPRLYAVGRPTDKSPVFVTANYKMSFDRLRAQLGGIDGWILVLDTKGINVWCAAGKGTLGTDELVRRVEAVRLKEIVSHRRLIVPQLGATGVSAHMVRERCGFHVTYGPIRAEDLRTYLAAGMRATPEMRQITFGLWERIVLIPVELVGILKYGLLASAAFFLLSGLGSGIYSIDRVASYGLTNAVLPLLAAITGAVLPAILLPWLPGRAFSIKGAVAGLLPMAGLALAVWLHPDLFRTQLSAVGWLLVIPAVTSFAGMGFTGCSTFTSLSGVKREMRIAVPAQLSFAVVGLGLWFVGLFV
jgi:hypothetical protein